MLCFLSAGYNSPGSGSVHSHSSDCKVVHHSQFAEFASEDPSLAEDTGTEELTDGHVESVKHWCRDTDTHRHRRTDTQRHRDTDTQ